MPRLFPALPLAVFSFTCFHLTPALRAEPVTPERIAGLPKEDQSRWADYLARSRAAAAADTEALQREVATLKLAQALPAPDGGDFKFEPKTGEAWFASAEAARLADTIISYQAPNGGWSKHTGYSKGPRHPGMQWSSQSLPGQPAHYLSTFDNGSTTGQIEFLAEVCRATGREDCRTAALRGLDFVFAAQFPSGGWPQVYPLEGGYHDDITFNDDSMTHVLELLRAIETGLPAFALVDQPRRERAALALAAGLRCVITTQIAQEGRKTAWCAQHDPITLSPAAARKMEPSAISGMESAHLLEFLMTLPRPAPEMVACIESGLGWLDRVKVTGMARVKRDGKTAYEPTPGSTEVYWARFYDLTDSHPIFPGRDGVIYPTYEAMAANNKVGYDFYTGQPASILRNGQKKWRKMLAKPDGN
ncbi:MAG: hypothetical protein RIQ79_1143 [Verrucomicrobiota bacterium]